MAYYTPVMGGDPTASAETPWWKTAIDVGTSLAHVFGGGGGAPAPSFRAATCPPAQINARVGPDGWWYDLSDGHQLSHEEAYAKCAQVQARPPRPMPAPTVPGATVLGVPVWAVVLLGGVLVGGAVLMTRPRRR